MAPRLGLAGVVVLYLALAFAYALRTPPWQAPDEPAHYNYIAHVAQGRGLPVLQPGDYDQRLVEELTTRKFPPDLPIEGLRYESHQPPLYYLLMAPAFKVTGGLPQGQQVVALRLFSLLLGVPLLLVAYGIVRHLFPADRGLAWATTAFLATVPQHLAVAAAVNNDLLGELVLSAVLLALLWGQGSVQGGLGRRKMVLVLGLLLGAALLTKSTAYGALALVPLGLLLRWRRHGKRDGHHLLLPLAGILGIALLVSGWWFARNLMVYGDGDFLGQQRHDTIVVGQPRWEALDGAAARAFLLTTFRSFWVQVGWMAVPADARAYVLLATVSGVALLGFPLFLWRVLRGPESLSADQRDGLVLLVGTVLLIFGAMALYNLRFQQPQGRYLFPAMVPLGLFFSLGLQEVIAARYRGLLLALVFGGLVLLNLWFVATLLPLLA